MDRQSGLKGWIGLDGCVGGIGETGRWDWIGETDGWTQSKGWMDGAGWFGGMDWLFKWMDCIGGMDATVFTRQLIWNHSITDVEGDVNKFTLNSVFISRSCAHGTQTKTGMQVQRCYNKKDCEFCSKARFFALFFSSHRISIPAKLQKEESQV